ncbi:DUF7118 family protein [Halosimplex marinum]|uniref:DUF7118 family protein n=1 Tax=Halosimplex marinum TaxID=3396620 RepID=UPI003F571FAE
MSDAAQSPADDPRAAADDLVADLREARDALQRARDRVDEVGESELQTVADTYDDLTALFDRYEEEVTGDGDFKTFIEFQSQIAAVVEEMPEDVRHREVFEEVDDLLQQRRLTESDWAKVRSALEPVREDVRRIDERDEARERYEDARFAVERRLDDFANRIDDLEDLQRLGDADLDAPTERLRGPIETYNDRVRDAFADFRSSASAREFLGFVAKTEAYPLVPFESPPADLREYVESHAAGEEPVGQLLEYAEYSKSKLDHYVDDPDALKRNVSTRRTYLRRLDAEPLTVDWPPVEAETLRFRARELTSVVARFADRVEDGEDALVALRDVRDLPRETDYERLRNSAQARAQLGPEERERLASGAVAEELEACRDAKEQLERALDEYPRL